jgi:signal peptide peptidase SppA
MNANTNFWESLYLQPWAIKEAAWLTINAQAQAKSFCDRSSARKPAKAEGNTAVISIAGVLWFGATDFEQKVFGAVDPRAIEADIDAALASSAVSRIELNIDSPGGTVSGISSLAAKVKTAGKVKPVGAKCISGMCCSAAYWVACAASSIVVSRDSDIGSIGVYQPLVDSSKFYELSGIKIDLVKSGKLKGAGYPGTPITDEYRQIVQGEVDTIFGWFKDAVKASRPRVKDGDMQGQSFLGEEAVKRGLADQIGTDPFKLEGRKPGQKEMLLPPSRKVQWTKTPFA